MKMIKGLPLGEDMKVILALALAAICPIAIAKGGGGGHGHSSSGSHSSSYTSGSSGSHSVRGYVTKDGTYVQPHHATNPNGTNRDNWSTKGNMNPYTGKEGTKNPD